MLIVLTLFAFVLTLLLVVGIHEAGHALMARLFKVKIKHIAIGFGRPLLQWQSKSGLKWIWALWPLGGSVRLLNTRIANVPKNQYSQCFDKQPVWVRTIILVAGVLTNLMLAWLALFLVFMIGINQRPPVLKKVKASSLAYQSGLRSGDIIESVDGAKIDSWVQFGQFLIIGMGRASLNLTVKTISGKQKTLNLDLKQWRIRPSDRSILSSLGISADNKVQKKLIIADSSWDAIKKSSNRFAALLYFFIIMLERIVTGTIPFTLLLGPVGILEVTVHSFVQGISVFAMFVASLSLAVAIINILPIPGLDGGSIIYGWIEKIRGKPMSIAMEVLLYQLALIIFVVLLINLLVNDMQRYL